MLGLAPVHPRRRAAQELLEPRERDLARPRREPQISEGIGEGVGEAVLSHHESRV